MTDQTKARWMLLMACVLWGVSFPAVRAICLLQEQLIPDASTWFVTGVTVTCRFALSSVLMLLIMRTQLKTTTRKEMAQGIGLGVFGGFALLLQADGLAYTAASTSAFLTQCSCLLLPLMVSLRDRRWPPWTTWPATLCVTLGIAILADVHTTHLQLGRGEVETLLSTVLFAFQILLLEKPSHAHNRTAHVTTLMFVTMTCCALPVALFHTHSLMHWKIMLTSPGIVFLIVILVLLCTMVASMAMNAWQRHIPSTQAVLIYCSEPVFAFLFAMFLPLWFSTWFAIDYPNETFSKNMMIGGGLIILANISEHLGNFRLFLKR